MNIEATKELHDALVDFRDDSEVWVGIITDTGDKVFCGGADLKEMLSYINTYDGQRQPRPITPMRGLEIWKPLITAINGSAFGGGMEIVLTCDIRIASEKAIFALPEVTFNAGVGRYPKTPPDGSLV